MSYDALNIIRGQHQHEFPKKMVQITAALAGSNCYRATFTGMPHEFQRIHRTSEIPKREDPKVKYAWNPPNRGVTGAGALLRERALEENWMAVSKQQLGNMVHRKARKLDGVVVRTSLERMRKDSCLSVKFASMR